MLIFDMDGTMIDSNALWRKVDEAFLNRHGYPYTREYCEGVAHTVFPVAAAFTKEYCHLEESPEEIMAQWMEMAGDAYARVPMKPHVREYLEQCKARGERMIVLTSSVPQHCHTALSTLGLTDYFEQIFFAQELKLEKRNPEIYRIVCRKMSAAASDCTLFDDSLEACRAAMQAGVHTVGVYDAVFDHTTDAMRRECERFITDFGELLEA